MLDNTLDNFEVCEKSAEKEQREKRDTDTKDQLDESEKFLIQGKDLSSLLSIGNAKYFCDNIGVPNFSIDVLTPPPELI